MLRLLGRNALFGAIRPVLQQIWKSLARWSKFAASRPRPVILIQPLVFEPLESRVLFSAGLSGAYFSNADLTGFKLDRTDSTINFNWGTYPISPTVPATVTSAKWTGFIEPQYSETYTLTTTSDDGSRVYINGQLVVNNWFNQAATSRSGTSARTASRIAWRRSSCASTKCSSAARRRPIA